MNQGVLVGFAFFFFFNPGQIMSGQLGEEKTGQENYGIFPAACNTL